MHAYVVISLLWLVAEERYAHPGEVVQLSDETADILLAAGAIQPAEEEA